MFSYQKSFVNPTLPVDEPQFYALVRATQWNENIDKYRETGEASLKRKLPAFIFQATFDETQSKNGKVGRWRKQAATRLTGLVVMDIDHIEDPRKVFEGWGLKTTTDDNITTTETTKTTFSGDNLSPQEEDVLQSHRPEVEKLSKLSELSLEEKNELSLKENSELSSFTWRGYDVQSITGSSGRLILTARICSARRGLMLMATS